ncbi:hypothetical protein [Fischerella thermalis]|uniref:Uncharacterized protein n=1 Tax=Fischerella thermalis CCMEE 5318 TaxID=2019666 RepID=A0A2N6LNA9_9CYAN|nr:hypothetical protein [Fischerella thermalis]PMB26923.1 hypothetical protein CEN46_02595 [Fischerella thermalis CCMEE 5318]
MFGFIKNLITGIMKFITGLLPGKKKGNGYYLELKEEAETTPVAAAKAAAEKVAAVAKSAADKVTELTESEADKAVSETNGAKQSPAPVAAAPETSNGAKDVKKPSRKTSIKSAKKAKAEAKPEPTVELVQTAEGVTVEVKEDKAPAVAAKAQPKETTFAPKYLIPTSTNGRRRPGANMNSFLEMARQVKTPASKSK